MTDNAELKRLAENHLSLGQAYTVAKPSVLLALIDENERLTKQWGDRPAYRTPEYESKRDAMWRRAHMVATSKGYDHINMAIAAAPNACADCMGCGGEWQGEGIPNSVCDTCKGSLGKTLEEERDQLRAEVAGLKTGYEAYERVNAELKAEVEGLRKDADRLQSATAFAQKLCDSAGKQPSVATGYLHDILAAMGKGEQS